MNDKTFVSCHAPSLALLLFETVSSSNDQKGLLLGSVKTHTVTTTTDENEVNEEEKTVIYIEHCLPLDESEVFGPYGEIKQKFFDRYYQTYRDKIVGWYTFRRNTRNTKLSMREAIIHRSLLQIVDSSETFAVALLSTSVQPTHATHTFNQTFWRLNRRNTFEALRFKIYTLSDKMTNSSGYLLPMSFPTSFTFERIVTSKGRDENGIRSVNAIHNSANQYLAQASKQLFEIEARRSSLQKAVDELCTKLGLRRTIPDLPETRPAVAGTKPELKPHILRYDPSVNYGLGHPQNVIDIPEEAAFSSDECDDCIEIEKSKLESERSSSLQSTGASVQLPLLPRSYADSVGKSSERTSSSTADNKRFQNVDSTGDRPSVSNNRSNNMEQF